MLAFEAGVAAEVIHGAVFGGGHEPRARIVRDARLGPLFKCSDQGILREVFGEADITHNPRKPGNEPGRLDPPDRVDSAMWIGSHHSYRSHHVQPVAATLERLLCEFEVFRSEHLANLGLAFKFRPVLPVQFHEAHR